MSAFFEAALSFPTVFFTVLVGLFLLYGLLSLAGAADLEWLDGILGTDSLDALGLSGVPIAIFGGVAAVSGWVVSMLITSMLGSSGLATLLLAGGLSLAAGLFAGAILTRPLRRLFRTSEAPSRRAYLGRICTIRSLTVDADSGRAEIDDGGAGLVVEVRCFRENELKPGAPALVYDIDDVTGIFHVAPIDPSIAEVNPELIAKLAEPELSSPESHMPRITQ
jgi:hypothetical protein